MLIYRLSLLSASLIIGSGSEVCDSDEEISLEDELWEDSSDSSVGDGEEVFYAGVVFLSEDVGFETVNGTSAFSSGFIAVCSSIYSSASIA